MEIPIEMVMEQLRSRLSDVEYENAILKAQAKLLQNGLIPVEEPVSPDPEEQA